MTLPELLLGVDAPGSHRQTTRRGPRAGDLDERRAVLRRDRELLAVRLVDPDLLAGRRIEREDAAVLIFSEDRAVVLELRRLTGQLEQRLGDALSQLDVPSFRHA